MAEFQQNASGGGRMYEDVEMSSGANFDFVGDEAHTFALQFFERVGDIVDVDGYMMPFSIEQGAKGTDQRRKMTFSKIEVNVPLDDGRFTMPGATPAAAAAAPADSSKGAAKADSAKVAATTDAAKKAAAKAAKTSKKKEPNPKDH